MLTKKQIRYLKENTEYNSNPVIKEFFTKYLTRKLKKDKDFMKSVDDLEGARDELKAKIKDMEKKGIKVPDELKKYAGLD